MLTYCTEDPQSCDDRDEERADDYSGNRHTAAALTGLPDLVQRENAEIRPRIGPMRQSHPNKEHTNDAMAMPFVPTPCDGGG